MKKFLYILFFVLPFGEIHSQNIFDLGHTTAYANHLYKTRQYALAAEEYERTLFISGGNDSLKTMLIRSYTLAGMYNKGSERAAQLYPDKTIIEVKPADAYLALLIRSSQYKEAADLVSINRNISAEMRKVYEVSLAFHMYNIQYIQSFYLLNDTAVFPVLKEFSPLVSDAQKKRLKSPALAACMSAIIPGSGKMYAKDYKDGVISMIFVSLSAWQAYRGFEKRGTKSIYGFIYGGLTLAFYTGNIFGATKSVRRYNAALKSELAESADFTVKRIVQ